MERVFLVAICTLALACSGATRQDTDRGPGGSAIVVRREELSGSLLDGLRVRVPAMTVANVQGSPCPLIMFRGLRSIRNQGNPSVYVDGTLMLDTCILQQISSSDVDRVEIYPNGQAARPEIRQNPFGIILVYRVRE